MGSTRLRVSNGAGFVRGVEAALTVGLVPGFVLSQWAAVRWGAGIRTAFNAVALLAILVVLVARRARLRHRPGVAAAAGVVVGVVAVAVVANRVPPSVALTGIVPYVGFPLVAVAAATTVADAGTVRRGVTVAAVVAAAAAVVAVAQLVWGRIVYVATAQDLPYPRWWERGRATGLVGNPGRWGQVGVLSVALAPLRIPGAGIVLAVAGAVAVGTSGTRIALLAVVVLPLAWWLTRAAEARVLAAGAVGAVLVAAVVLAVVPAARSDLASRTSAVTGTEAVDVRTENLRATGRLLADRPLLGAGPGRFGSSTAWRHRSPLHGVYGLPDVRSEEFVAALREAGDTREIDVGIAQLELGWAQIAAELGLAGVAAVLALWAMLLLAALRARRPAATALLLGLGVLTVGSPGLADLSLTTVAVWWAGVDIARGQGAA